MTTKPRILFIIPSDFDALKRKGVINMILERDENGFFERVISVHPITQKTQRVYLNEKHVLYDIGLDIIPGLNKYLVLRIIQAPFHFIRVIRRLIILVKKENINIIRATDPYFAGLFALIASMFTKIPCCISIHSDYDKRYQLDPEYGAPKIFGSRKFAKYIEHLTLSRVKMVMPIRETLAQKAIMNGAKPETIRIIPHGIDMAPLKQLPKNDIYKYFEIDRNSKIISFVGRLSKENYVDDVLTLAKKLSRVRNDFVIVMAGGGAEKDRLKKLVANDKDLNRVIRLVGFQSREVCLDLRRASAVSLCLMAGFSLIEACAAGHPVVAYDVEWHSELVKNDETGFLVREHDIDGLVKSVSYLLDNPEKALQMGENAQAFAFDRHDINKTSAIKRQYYQELLKGKPADKSKHNPILQIMAENPWYTDDQFASQLSNPGSRSVIEKRWNIFEKALIEWKKNAGLVDKHIYILDAGCGDGINLFAFSEVIKRHKWDAKLFGIDYNPIRTSRATCIAGVNGVYLASLYTLPFADRTFDVILCNQVLEHIPDDLLVLNELHRVLKRDGLLILGVPNEGCILARLRNHVLQPSISRSTDHINFYTAEALSKKMNDAGFQIVHMERKGFFTPHLRLQYLITAWTIGRKALDLLGSMISSQSAELIIFAKLKHE